MIRALIVDDERPARAKLQRLLEGVPDIKVAGEAESGPAAVELIADLRPDLVFLDVQMPELDGFGVLAALEPSRRPAIVFVTAFDEFAVKAFEVNALDYLLKPVDPDRFALLLERVRHHVAAGTASPAGAGIERLLTQLDQRPRYLERLLVTLGEHSVLLKLAEVTRIEAARNYLTLHSQGRQYLTRGALGSIEERLDPARWVRVNRSEIVQIDRIARLEPWFHGEYRLLLDDGARVTWSRRFLSRADEILGRFA